MPKKAKSERALFIPQEQSHWETYVEEGFENNPTQVEVLLPPDRAELICPCDQKRVVELPGLERVA